MDFEDYPGSYVNHCHILFHEDAGMMAVVRVISGIQKILGWDWETKKGILMVQK